MQKKIQYILGVFLVGLLGLPLNAQEDFRSNAPKPGPATRIELGKSEQFKLDNGLEVIVVENHKLPRISVQLFVNVPPLPEGEKAGLSQIAGQLLEAGTTNREKAEIDHAIDFIGASLSASANGVFGTALSKHKETLVDLISDVLLHPAFPEAEFEKIKKQTISGITLGKDDPGQMSANVSNVVTYGKDHPYGELLSEVSVSLIDLEDCKKYYQTFFKPNLSYLVFVGDITAADAKKMAKKYFDKWEQSFVLKDELVKPKAPEGNQVNFVSKPGAVQSVVNITYPVDYKPGSPDAIKISILNQILGGAFFGRLFKNIREDKGYSYGAYSSISNDPVVGSFSANANVRNEVTDSAIVEFLYEMKRISTELVTDEELQTAKNMLMGSFARSMEQPSTIASFALNIARFKLPADYYATYLERLNTITKADILEAAKKYIKPNNAHIVVVGDREVGEKLKVFAADGKLNYYDGQGNEIQQVKMILPQGTTAEGVVEDYLKAIGGVQALNNVNDMTVSLAASIQGMNMEMKRVVKKGKMMIEVKAGGMVMNEVKFDGEKAMVSQMGQQQEVDEATIEGFKEDAQLFPELAYKDLGFKLQLVGAEMLEGKKVYVIEIESANGEKQTDYFDMKSSLKIRSQSNQNGTLLQTDFDDYRTVDGIMVPYKIVSIGMAPFPLAFEVQSVAINTGIEDALFKVE
ncbi:MAG: insulinase family protein [Saprospiraceae bacterium]